MSMNPSARMDRVLKILKDELETANKDFKESSGQMEHFHDVVTLLNVLNEAEFGVYAKRITKLEDL